MTLSRIAAIAVAGALTVGPAPAAAPACQTPTGYAAGAGAEVMTLDALDLRPLGLPVGPVTDLRLGSTRSAMDGEAGPVKAAAAARHLDAALLGADLPAGPLSQSAYQQAPPRNAKPVTVRADRRDLGVASAGAGDLTAYATWHAGLACGTNSAEATHSSATVAGTDVLAGAGGVALVRIPAAQRARTATGLRAGGSPVATASAGLSEARLFAGTPAQVTVKVIQPAELTVGRDVAYRAPIVEVSGPGIGTRRLDAPGQVLDVPLGGLGGTIGALKPERLDGVTGRVGDGPLDLPGLPAFLDPPRGGELPVLGTDDSLIRVTVGTLTKEVTGASARAEATTLRLQVATRPPDEDTATVLDMSLGLLDALVLAPRPGPAAAPQGAGGGLPVTGANVAWTAAAGALLIVTGGAVMVATRRRRATVRLIHDRTYG
jgi:LPXTG-motif cell wall-anchored protein